MKKFKIFAWIIAILLVAHCAVDCMPYLQYQDKEGQTQNLSLASYIAFPHHYSKTVDKQITSRFKDEYGADYEFDINAIVWGNILIFFVGLLFAFFQLRFGGTGSMCFFTLVWSLYGFYFYFTNKYMVELVAGPGTTTRLIQIIIFAAVAALSVFGIVTFFTNLNKTETAAA